MKTKAILIATLMLGTLLLSSFADNKSVNPSLKLHSNGDPVLLGTIQVPYSGVNQTWNVYGTVGTGYQGEDTITGATNTVTFVSDNAAGHTYGTGQSQVTLTIYNSNNSVYARYNGPLSGGTQ